MKLSKHILSVMIVICWYQSSFILCVMPDCPIVVTSIPKTGTHLLEKCVMLITKKSPLLSYVLNSSIFRKLPADQFLIGHIPYTEKNGKKVNKNSCKAIFIYRDPRDQLVSFVYWIYKNPEVWPTIQNLSFDTLLSKLIADCSDINGIAFDRKVSNVAEAYNAFLPWIKNPAVYTTTFEKLVGPCGKGTREAQLVEIRNIARHLGVNLLAHEIIDISCKIFGDSGTFRVGEIGSWKSHFKPEHIEAFKKIPGASQLLIELGYEQGTEWR